MTSFAHSFLTTILPVAIALMPMLVAMLAIASLAEVVMKAMPSTDAPSGVVLRAVGTVRRVAMRALVLFFVFMLVAVNLTAFQAQRDFEAFSAQ